MNDKERIKDLLVDIDSFLVEKGGDDVIVNWDGQTPRSLLEFIKKDLEKMTMNDKEKIEKALELIISFEPLEMYRGEEDPETSERLVKEIKEILEN